MMLLPSATTADGAHATFTVTNTSATTLRLLPTSDLPLVVIVVRADQASLYARAADTALDVQTPRTQLVEAWSLSNYRAVATTGRVCLRCVLT